MAAIPEDRFTLYYFPVSFFSQKVLLALWEKGIPFKEKYVHIHKGEQNAEWYMKINPRALVPALQDGDKIITESANIISYLDTVCTTGPKLCPDTSTTIGKDVARFSTLLTEVEIDIITYGIIHNPELAGPGPGLRFTPPGFPRNPEAWKTLFTKRVAGYNEMAEQCPHLREEYLAKAQRIKKFHEDFSDKEKVLDSLKKMDAVFDELENQLRRVKQGMTDQQQTSDSFLCGQQLTVADIHLIVWLLRFNFLGLLDRYAGREKHPLLYAYNERITQRPSVKRIVQTKSQALRLYLPYMVRAVAPSIGGLAVLGLAGALAFMLYKKYK